MPYLRSIRPRSKPRPGRLKGEDLDALRLACFLRDKGLCVRCGKRLHFIKRFELDEDAYEMAHIKAKRISLDSLDNVEALCMDCHRKQHAYGPSMKKPVPAKERAS